MTTELNDLLVDIAHAIQPTDAQNERASSAYRSVGEWLAADPVLKPYLPIIYPQGSRALGTANCPLHGGEHDVDLVFQCRLPVNADPQWLYNAVLRRLASHGDYSKRIKLRSRCICLIYAGDFHLDVLPARPDMIRLGTFVEIPDRELLMWLTSNPLGYVKWFESQCDPVVVLLKRAGVPLPPNTPVDLKPILKIAVQLAKRHRDVVFDSDPDNAARSIVITTLIASAYRGETSLSLVLLAALREIEAKIAAAAPGRIVVENPANPGEKFSDKFTPVSYAKFTQFIRNFRIRIEKLLATRGLDELTPILSEMFGEEPTHRVVKSHALQLQDHRQNRVLRATATGLSTVGSGRIVRPNSNFGDDD